MPDKLSNLREETVYAGHNGTAITHQLWSMAVAGWYGTAVAGQGGIALIPTGPGTAKAGAGGLAITGSNGRATAGLEGIAIGAGRHAIMQAGVNGTLVAFPEFQNISVSPHLTSRVCVGHIGEDGLLPNTPYIYKEGKFVQASLEDGI